MNEKSNQQQDVEIIGWREWVSLPKLGIPHIKAKVDTGARTSALHAFKLNPYKEKGRQRIKFSIHPLQKDMETVIDCDTEVADIRWITDSGGHREKRYVIQTPITIGTKEYDIEITLTNRDTMQFRMLLGRNGIKPHFIVNPAISYAIGKLKK